MIRKNEDIGVQIWHSKQNLFFDLTWNRCQKANPPPGCPFYDVMDMFG